MTGYKIGAVRVPIRFLRQIKHTWESARNSYREQVEWQAMLKTRQAVIDAYLAKHQIRKLQIGAGENPLESWMNTDLEPISPGVIFLDATQVFPFQDNVFDYAFSEHMIEHIPYKSGLIMLREIFRVLRPGGRVRIATPDMSQIVGLYSVQKTDIQKRYLEWNSREVMGLYSPTKTRMQEIRPEWDIEYKHIMSYYPDGSRDSTCFVVNNMFSSYGHQFLYDAYTLRSAMDSVGFDEIIQLAPDESPDDNLRGIDGHQKLIGKEMNRVETMVFEGIRPAG